MSQNVGWINLQQFFARIDSFIEPPFGYES
jgi:hypothetical protein